MRYINYPRYFDGEGSTSCEKVEIIEEKLISVLSKMSVQLRTNIMVLILSLEYNQFCTSRKAMTFLHSSYYTFPGSFSDQYQHSGSEYR